MKIVDVPMTGKLGLTVTYPGRNGLIRRTKVSPRNPRSSEQVAQRSILRSCAQGYDALTTLQQDAWIAAAAKFKSRATLGQSGPLTGLQLYVKVNASKLTIGEEAVTTPPAVVPETQLPLSALVITNTTGTIALKLTSTDTPPEGTMLWGCAPQNSGVRRVVGARFLGTLNTPSAGAIDITTAYAAKFGAPGVGTRVFVQVNTNQNGYEGLRRTFHAVVPNAS